MQAKRLLSRSSFVFLLLLIILLFPAAVQTARADSRVSSKHVTLLKGCSKTLKLKGTKTAVRWSSSKPSVVTVNQKGVITGKSAGTATVKASVRKKSWSWRVTVKAPALNHTSMTLLVGHTLKLKVKGTSCSCVWRSTAPSVVTVSKDGTIKAKKAGSADIRAIISKKYVLSCHVQVLKNTDTLRHFRSVAHRGYDPVTHRGQNKASSYQAAASHGFTHAECDLQFTLDGIPVCSHGDVFTDSLTGEEVTISKTTFRELRKHSYSGSRISTFEEVLNACRKSHLHLYIDKIALLTTQERWNYIFSLVESCGMKENVSWLVQNLRHGEMVLSWNPRASLTLLVNKSSLLNAAATANRLKTPQNTVSISVCFENRSIEELKKAKQKLEKGITIELWTINSIADYRKFLPYVSGITSDRYCLSDVLH